MANLLQMMTGQPQGGGMLGDPIFHMGLGMLSQAGPQPHPTGMSGVATGALQGMQNLQGFQQNQMLNQFRGAQTESLKSRTAMTEQALQMAQQLAAGETDPHLRALAATDPQAYLRLKTGAGQSSGNTPIWGQNKEGKWVLGRFTPKGFEEVVPPEGVELMPVAQDPNLAGQRRGATEQAAADVQLEMGPRIKYAEEMSKVDAFLDTAEKTGDAEALKAYKIEIGKAEGQGAGEAKTLLSDMESNMPNLEVKIEELRQLAPVATYTYLGLGRDWIARQTNMGPGEAGVARARYNAIVDNEILPLLKQTFGSQFTAQEGAQLKQHLDHLIIRLRKKMRYWMRLFVLNKGRSKA